METDWTQDWPIFPGYYWMTDGRHYHFVQLSDNLYVSQVGESAIEALPDFVSQNRILFFCKAVTPDLISDRNLFVAEAIRRDLMAWRATAIQELRRHKSMTSLAIGYRPGKLVAREAEDQIVAALALAKDELAIIDAFEPYLKAQK